MIEIVLVPHDLTELGDAGLEGVQSLGVPVGRVHVVHVLPRIDLTHPTLVWPVEEDEARREHALNALKARLAGTDFGDAVLHVRIGDPGSRIVELAREIGAQLVVLPSHSRRGLERLVLGSVAEHVARFAPCPVLVLPRGATLPAHPQAPCGPTDADQTPQEQVDALAVEILTQVERRSGFLSAARIAVPPDRDPSWWEDALTKRLAACGIEFVDLVLATCPGGQARVLDLRFEERFV